MSYARSSGRSRKSSVNPVKDIQLHTLDVGIGLCIGVVQALRNKGDDKAAEGAQLCIDALRVVRDVFKRQEEPCATPPAANS